MVLRPLGHPSIPTGETPPRWRSPWPWLLLTVPPAILAWWLAGGLPASRRPIVVGILHSLSGPMAEDEKPLIDAERAALEEINRTGGLLGRRVEWLIADGGSDAATFARRADRLIREDNADVIVGGGPNALRRAIVPIVEDAGHLLVFPQRHEGFEESAAVVSLGPLPNQVVGPALAWCRETLSAGSFFLVKGDDTWSRSAAAFASDQLTVSGARIVGDADFADTAGDAIAVAEKIAAAAPDVVCCLLKRDSCAALLRRLRESGRGAADFTILLLCLDEDDIRAMPREDVTGTYVAAPYFRASGDGANGFRSADKGIPVAAATGAAAVSERRTSARTLAAWDSIQMWAAAVRACGTADVAVVRAAIRHQTLDTAEGVVAVDASNRHAWRNAVVGRIRADGVIEHVWTSTSPTRPTPFPATRSRAEWMRFLAASEKGRANRTEDATGSVAPEARSDGTAGGTR